MNIKRYRIVNSDSFWPGWDTYSHPDGEWVKWEDVEKLLAERTMTSASEDIDKPFNNLYNIVLTVPSTPKKEKCCMDVIDYDERS